ncbi:uncharacterized protein LOC124162324 [Ischnura elegans]|uniref:uncharacterized protein LOC124162324 n=1 Tax=Ischnura elegans TaxID=197161 RepID=UPI001ED8909C|nr:uncharacterized protein LOC124162324 [Ischnura elegans]
MTAPEPEMDLPWLEINLGVKYASCKRGQVVLPRDKFQWLEEQTEKDGTTLLMKAVKEGDADCVELLLMCGVDVNGSRSRKYVEQRAIDFAIEKDHRRVVEILLKWDSILPDSDSTFFTDKLKIMSEENEDIKKFFEERDKFHELVRNGDIFEIEKILKGREDYVNISRCKHWVNRRGESSLYTAVMAGKHDAWALLLSRKFESLETEANRIEMLQKDKFQRKKFDRAMGKYFLEVENAHAFKLLSKTKVRGWNVEKRLDIKKIYLDANKVPEADTLMQCLQYDSHLEVIFELERSDVTNLCSMASTGDLGAMDPHLHRVYASAGLESHAKVVSNLIHEFCHRVMYNVFMNNGLPYRKYDQKMQNDYENIFFKIMSPENIHKCNPIIQRVKAYDTHLQQEVIVRIPEIITEGTIGGEEGNLWNTEIEKELSKFYHDHVEKEIKDYIKNHTAKQRISPLDIMSHPSILSGYQKDYAHVGEIGQPEMCFHHGIKYIRVSDLSLGISHMEKSLEDIVTVDLSFFMRSKTYFVAQLERGYFQNLIVVWDNETEVCGNPDSCSCLANIFQNHEEYVTLLVSKELKSYNKEECVDYEWRNLSEGTKEWILKQHVIFQGTNVVLQDLLEGLLFNEETESKISTSIGPKDISLIIQQKKHFLGNDVESDLEKKIGKMLYGHPQTFFPRRTKLRPLAFDEELMKQRKMDAIFFLHAKEDDLKEANVCKVRPWEGVKTQADDVRHFFLEENIDAAEWRKYCQQICEELRGMPNSDGSWMYAHFFLKNKKKKDFIHIHSERINDQRCLLLADGPGSGKSVFLHSEAKNEKLKNKDKWIEVVPLTECEGIMKKWMGTEQNWRVEDFLYQLINRRRVNGDDLTLEKALFSLFCHSEERVRIYFDGFDEICPAFKEIVSSFLEKLLENTSVNVVVSTRPNQREDLEKRLTTIAHSLVPFEIKEQVEFLNRQWNGMLKLLPMESRREKIRAITARQRDCNRMDAILTENIGEGSNQDADTQDYNFEKAAEVLIKESKSHLENAAHFSEIPLQAYMMAYVYFENDFFKQNSLNIFRLFKNFVVFKIELYLKEKANVSESQTAMPLSDSFATFVLKTFKNFSVNLFLAESTYKPTNQEKDSMLSTGILVEREGSIEFIHRSFAEYFFCCRLFDEDAIIRDVLFKKVLLDEEFETVRNFIDAMILSETSRGNVVSNERGAAIASCQSLLNEGKTYGISLCRRVFLQAISENHAGILQFLGAMSREYLSTVMFVDSNDDSNTFKEEKGTAYHNAFSLCSECNDAKKRKERPKYMIIHTMLKIAETNNLIGDLREYISKKGLRWTCLDRQVFTKKNSSENMTRIIDFFFEHKETLKEPLKNCLMGTEGNYFFQRALYDDSTFKEFMSLTEAIFVEEDFQLLFTPVETIECSIFGNTWADTLTGGTLERVDRFWRYLESKLTPGEARVEFLQRRNKEGLNSLSLSIYYSKSLIIAKHVTGILARELEEIYLKDYIFQSFVNLNSIGDFSKSLMMDWLETEIRQYLCIDDVLHVLLSKDKHGKRYMLDFFQLCSYNYWYKLLKILDDHKGHCDDKIKEILLSISFFENRLYLFPPLGKYISKPLQIPKEEIDPIWQNLMRFDLLYDVPLDDNLDICSTVIGKYKRFRSRNLVDKFVVLWKQMELESKYFSKDEIATRIKDSVIENPTPDSKNVTFYTIKGMETIVAPLFFPFLFSTLLHFLPIDDVADALIYIYGFILHTLDGQKDPLLFVEFYNVVNRTDLRICGWRPFKKWAYGSYGETFADSVGWKVGDTLGDAVNKKYKEIQEWAESNRPDLINHEGRLKSIYDILEMHAVAKYGHHSYRSLPSYFKNDHQQSRNGKRPRRKGTTIK